MHTSIKVIIFLSGYYIYEKNNRLKKGAESHRSDTVMSERYVCRASEYAETLLGCPNLLFPQLCPIIYLHCRFQITDFFTCLNDLTSYILKQYRDLNGKTLNLTIF